MSAWLLLTHVCILSGQVVEDAHSLLSVSEFLISLAPCPSQIVPVLCAADARQAGQQSSQQRGSNAAVADEDERPVRFRYHAAGYDPTWLVPYAVQACYCCYHDTGPHSLTKLCANLTSAVLLRTGQH